MNIFKTFGALALIWPSIVAAAADYPTPKQGEWLASDFKFNTWGRTQVLKLYYTAVSDSDGLPGVLLHGTGGSTASVLSSALVSELSATAQPLYASQHY